MLDNLAEKVKSTNELTVVYGAVIVVTDYCLNNNRGNWIIVIIHFPWLFLFSLTTFQFPTFPGFPEEWPPWHYVTSSYRHNLRYNWNRKNCLKSKNKQHSICNKTVLNKIQTSWTSFMQKSVRRRWRQICQALRINRTSHWSLRIIFPPSTADGVKFWHFFNRTIIAMSSMKLINYIYPIYLLIY